MKVKTKISAHISKKYLHDKGVELGLLGDALDMFKCFTEVPLMIEVDDKGIVRDVKALWMELCGSKA